MFRRSSRIRSYVTPLVWLSACFLLFAPTSHNTETFLVLCVGADGHVKLENGYAGTCACLEKISPASAQPDLVPVIDTFEKDTSHCGFCADLYLSLGSTAGQPKASIETTSTPQTCLSTTCAVDISTDRLFLIADTGACDCSGSPFFDPLYSIRLLI